MDLSKSYTSELWISHKETLMITHIIMISRVQLNEYS